MSSYALTCAKLGKEYKHEKEKKANVYMRERDTMKLPLLGQIGHHQLEHEKQQPHQQLHHR
jgi:hypothetical protein